MDEKILEHCKMLNQYECYLREISASPKDQFAGSYLLKGSAERYLQLAIESCINIGNRLLSIIQMQKPVKTPETYADIFTELGKLEILPQKFVNTMIMMVRFRNRVVHMYWNIDPDQLYTILNENLGDFTKFREYIVDFMNSEHI
ncbi:MAG: type VII toxin-antitoxin system HepT family RNase toxin [Desulfomonilia bacterium]|jgi:uncharacterized protein YutE (UPF0331/DUF86 family)|nr:DUF86 domain-containing protein [Deltaproteobacteria bacterium]